MRNGTLSAKFEGLSQIRQSVVHLPPIAETARWHKPRLPGGFVKEFDDAVSSEYRHQVPAGNPFMLSYAPLCAEVILS